MNSIRAVERALDYEIRRQSEARDRKYHLARNQAVFRSRDADLEKLGRRKGEDRRPGA